MADFENVAIVCENDTDYNKEELLEALLNKGVNIEELQYCFITSDAKRMFEHIELEDVMPAETIGTLMHMVENKQSIEDWLSNHENVIENKGKYYYFIKI